MDKIAYFFILWGMFVSCSSGYDIEINDNNEDEQNASTTIKYENIIILGEEDVSKLSYTENNNEITFTNLFCDINNGDYIMSYPNHYFDEGLLIKIDNFKTHNNKVIISKGDIDLREIYSDFSYSGPLIFESLETRSSLTSLKYSDSIQYNGLKLDYTFEGGINFLDSQITIDENGANAWFKIRVYGKCKANVSGTLNVATIKVPLFNLLNYNVKIPYAKNKYLSLPISIKVPCSLDISCEKLPINGTLIEKDFDRIFELGDNLSNHKTRTLSIENKDWGVNMKIERPDSIQAGFCIGVQLSTFKIIKIAQVDLEHGIKTSFDLHPKIYGINPQFKWHYFIRLFGYYRTLWNLSDTMGKVKFDELLWQSESDSLKLYPSYKLNNFDPLLSISHTMINFNDMHVLNGPLEYGYVIHEKEELPSYSSSSYIVRGVVNNTGEIELNKVRDFLYDFNDSNFDPGEYYIEPYVKTELGITALPFERHTIKSNISIPDDDDDDWIVD